MAGEKHRIVITLVVEGDYGEMEANPEYSSEALTERLADAFTDWSILGKDKDVVWVEDIKDLEWCEKHKRWEPPTEVNK